MIPLVYIIMNPHHLIYKIQQNFLFKVQLMFLKGKNPNKCIHDWKPIQTYNRQTLVYCYSITIFQGKVI